MQHLIVAQIESVSKTQLVRQGGLWSRVQGSLLGAGRGGAVCNPLSEIAVLMEAQNRIKMTERVVPCPTDKIILELCTKSAINCCASLRPGEVTINQEILHPGRIIHLTSN